MNGGVDLCIYLLLMAVKFSLFRFLMQKFECGVDGCSVKVDEKIIFVVALLIRKMIELVPFTFFFFISYKLVFIIASLVTQGLTVDSSYIPVSCLALSI